MRQARPDDPPLDSAPRTDHPPADLERVLRYLRGATVLVATSAEAVDALDPTEPRIGAMRVLTDGSWVWPSDIVHYVREHGFAVDEALLRRVRERDHRPPAVDQDEQNRIIDELLAP